MVLLKPDQQSPNYTQAGQARLDNDECVNVQDCYSTQLAHQQDNDAGLC